MAALAIDAPCGWLCTHRKPCHSHNTLYFWMIRPPKAFWSPAYETIGKILVKARTAYKLLYEYIIIKNNNNILFSYYNPDYEIFIYHNNCILAGFRTSLAGVEKKFRKWKRTCNSGGSCDIMVFFLRIYEGYREENFMLYKKIMIPTKIT